MAKTIVHENESIDDALRRFKRYAIHLLKLYQTNL